MAAADLVIAHAGTGTALSAFEVGVAPVLVPRRSAHGEHVDDHQVVTARNLAERGLVTALEVEELTEEQLFAASTRTVVQHDAAPPLPL